MYYRVQNLVYYKHFWGFQKIGTYMIQDEEIEMSTMFEVVIYKNEHASEFERPEMTVVALPSISVSGFVRSWVR